MGEWKAGEVISDEGLTYSSNRFRLIKKLDVRTEKGNELWLASAPMGSREYMGPMWVVEKLVEKTARK